MVRASDTISLRCITRRRLIFVLAVGFVRALVALALLLVGGIWLSRTSNLESMVLNGAALSFVLELDELLFHAFGPDQSKTIMVA